MDAFVDFSTGLRGYDDMMVTGREAMEDYVNDLLVHDRVLTLLIVEGEALLGLMIGYPDWHKDEVLECFYVSDLYVSPTLRSQGWGTKLLQAAEVHARELGLTRMRIGVLEANERAGKLYRAMGYEPHISLMLKSLD